MAASKHDTQRAIEDRLRRKH